MTKLGKRVPLNLEQEVDWEESEMEDQARVVGDPYHSARKGWVLRRWKM